MPTLLWICNLRFSWYCIVGLAQCAELCWQLRGLAGERQVRDAMLALQHNLGLGGAAIVTLYRLGFPEYVRYCIGTLI